MLQLAMTKARKGGKHDLELLPIQLLTQAQVQAIVKVGSMLVCDTQQTAVLWLQYSNPSDPVAAGMRLCRPPTERGR